MYTSSSTDKAIDDLRKGVNRESAFRQLFDEYYPYLVRFFAMRGMSAPDSQDLAQEVFSRVFSEISNFREEAKFLTWLLVIASNSLKNWLRRQGAWKRRADETTLEDAGLTPGETIAPVPETRAPGADPLEEILEQERRRALRAALEELPPRMRQTMMLRVNGHSYPEIAKLLDVSPNLVRKTLYLARERLRRHLEEYLRGESELDDQAEARDE